jgi:hypothetical protein
MERLLLLRERCRGNRLAVPLLGAGQGIRKQIRLSIGQPAHLRARQLRQNLSRRHTLAPLHYQSSFSRLDTAGESSVDARNVNAWEKLIPCIPYHPTRRVALYGAANDKMAFREYVDEGLPLPERDRRRNPRWLVQEAEKFKHCDRLSTRRNLSEQRLY